MQKRSLSSLILQGISYREQTQTTHTTFSVYTKYKNTHKIHLVYFFLALGSLEPGWFCHRPAVQLCMGEEPVQDQEVL